MSPPITPITTQRLVIAKEMYLQGVNHNANYSYANVIPAILNFDYAAETLIKTALLDSGISLSHNRTFKDFPILISELQSNFPTLSSVILNEVNGLHRLRNEVQHNAQIPSAQSAKQFEVSVKLFFDDIFSKVYANAISFDDISLFLFLESKLAKILLGKADALISTGNYTEAVYLARMAVMYLLQVRDEELGRPNAILQASRLGSPSPTQTSDHDLEDVQDDIHSSIDDIAGYLQRLEGVVEWLVGAIPTIEYKHEITQLFGNQMSALAKRQRPTRENMDKSQAENAKALATAITMKIESVLGGAKDLKRPFIYDLTVTTKDRTVNILVGCESASELISAKWQLVDTFFPKNIQEGVLVKGTQEITFNLDLRQMYRFGVILQDANGTTTEYLSL